MKTLIAYATGTPSEVMATIGWMAQQEREELEREDDLRNALAHYWATQESDASFYGRKDVADNLEKKAKGVFLSQNERIMKMMTKSDQSYRDSFAD